MRGPLICIARLAPAAWCLRTVPLVVPFIGSVIGPVAQAADNAPLRPQSAFIQSADTQGQIQQQRQQERDEALRKLLQPAPDVRLPAPMVPADAAAPDLLSEQELPCFNIQRIELQGPDAALFEWALLDAPRTPTGQADSPIGRCLGAQGVNTVLSRVQNAIIARGFVTTRVLAPAQNLQSGTLALTVFAGRVRAIRTTADSGPRARLGNALPIRSGDILNLRDIEQGLENLQRVPSVQADVQIVPAQGSDAGTDTSTDTSTHTGPGQSDLLVRWVQERAARFALFLDDGGSRSTGKFQAGLTTSIDHALTLNDLFYFSYNHDAGGGNAFSRGTQGQALHYSVPAGHWLWSFNASQSSYRQVVPGFDQLIEYSGASSNADVRASYLLYRDGVHKSSAHVKAWLRSSNNLIDEQVLEVQHRRMAGWELGLSHKATFDAATLDASVSLRRGTGAMGSLPAAEEPYGEGSSRPHSIAAELQLSRPFKIANTSLRYTSVLRAQFNRTPLVPQDRFAIGGRYTVRGFDGESSLSADRGWLVRQDLIWPLGTSGQELYLGIDSGHVGGPSAQFLVGRNLSGAVLGLRGSIERLSYDLFWGAPLHKPTGFETADSTGGFNLNLAY